MGTRHRGTAPHSGAPLVATYIQPGALLALWTNEIWTWPSRQDAVRLSPDLAPEFHRVFWRRRTQTSGKRRGAFMEDLFRALQQLTHNVGGGLHLSYSVHARAGIE